MAKGAVGARTEGDVFQGIVFWREAAPLLNESGLVEAVEIEYDLAAGVDDVAVFYKSPGKHTGETFVQADFYQCKYHVDRSKSYSSNALIDPIFISPKSKRSILERFLGAFNKILPTHGMPRLFLISNWSWDANDPLGPLIREREGELPEAFFSQTPGRPLGKIREMWRAHLKQEPDDFEKFARCLRFKVDQLSRQDFARGVYGEIVGHGLLPPSLPELANKYDALYQRFITDGPTRFSASSLEEICRNEGLLNNSNSLLDKRVTIGVRSFDRATENFADETASHICVNRYFTGRHPRDGLSWDNAAKSVTQFLTDPTLRSSLRGATHRILLDCHGTLALLAGYELSRNSAAQICPVQKSSSGPMNWVPTNSGGSSSARTWEIEELELNKDGEDGLVVVLSVTHDIRRAVRNHLSRDLNFRPRIMLALAPQSGPGYSAIEDAFHACELAEALVNAISATRRKPTECVHLFFAAPNGMMFFIGQFRDALGRVAIYEYDFDPASPQHGSYYESLSLPAGAARTTAKVGEDA